MTRSSRYVEVGSPSTDRDRDHVEHRGLVSRNSDGAMPEKRGPQLHLLDRMRKRGGRADAASRVSEFARAARSVFVPHMLKLFGMPTRQYRKLSLRPNSKLEV